MTKKRIVLSTFGSLGDLFPYIAVAKRLGELDCSAVIATNLEHRPLVEKHGVEFAHVGPDIQDFTEAHPDLMARIMDRKTGTEFVLREIMMKNVRRSYDMLLAASAGADLIVTHALSYAGLLVARKRQLPFISSVLAPINFWSNFDPPALCEAPWLPALHQVLGPVASGFIMKRMKHETYEWSEPYRALQAELGLEVDKRNPFFEGIYSPLKHLGLFSPVFGPPQRDWPTNTVATGFPFLDTEDMPEDTRQRTRDFLQNGDPPVVLTLGSSAVFDPGDFWMTSIEALKATNQRGVLLVGPAPGELLPGDLPETILAVDYLPHSLIFRHASAIVHQGGVGTTAQALRSGKPQIVMPWSHDQFDNAARVKRLGCGIIAQREKYTVSAATKLIKEVVDGRYHNASAAIAKQIQSENGVEMAAAEIAAALS
jgi:rhamnosyltransferase subunit B